MYFTIKQPWGQQKPALGSQIDWGHPLARGLVGCWLFNEGAGKSATDLCNRAAGALIADAIYAPLGIAFDGTGDTVNVGRATHLDFNTATPFSVRFVFSCANFGAQNGLWPVYVSHCSGSYQQDGWFIFAEDGAGSVAVGMGTNAYSTRHYTANVLSTNTPYDVTLTYNGDGSYSGWCVYIDAISKFMMGTTNPVNPTYGGTVQTSFASQNDTRLYMTGAMGRVQIYSRALSAAEVAWLYAEPYAFIQAPEMPVFYSVPAAVTIYSRRGLTNRAGTRTVWT